MRALGYSGREDDTHKTTVDCALLNSIGIDVNGSIANSRSTGDGVGWRRSTSTTMRFRAFRSF